MDEKIDFFETSHVYGVKLLTYNLLTFDIYISGNLETEILPYIYIR